MTKERSIAELYLIAESAIPEPGIHEAETKKLLQEAVRFGEGVICYFQQSTCEMARVLMSKRNTYHAGINDYEFQKRVLAALESSPPRRKNS